uniref:Protein DIS3 homolog n=1 Tax=Plectus sambesii TaxID=2011161 RepID=A0A914US77_9BILA
MELNVKQSGISRRTLKIFHKNTRSGGIVKVVREHYLRNDIPCGLPNCTICPSAERGLLSDVDNSSISSVINEQHIILVDVSILLHKTDVLADDCFSNVIIAQTAWEAVKQKSPPAYKKVHHLVFHEERGFFVFMNDFHEETYAAREPGESADGRNDRALRKTAKFFVDHLAELGSRSKKLPKLVLLCDSVESRDRARAEGLISFSFAEYVKGITSKPELADKLAAFESRDEIDPKTGAPRGRLLFPEHLSADETEIGLKTGRLKKGSFQVSRDNYMEASVYVDDEGSAWFVQGLLNCNRAVHDDLVAVELLPEEEWSCPARLLKIRDQEESGPNADAELDTDEVNTEDSEKGAPSKKRKRDDLLPTARVVGIIRRNWRPYCGVLLPSSVPGARRHLFAAAERRIPRIRIETRQADTLKGQRVIVAIDSWPRDSRYPLGHYVRSLGTLGDRATENEVLLLEHDIPHYKFSSAVLDCLPAVPWRISDEERTKRVDLRDLVICSVDPPGCTDIDDALHCRSLDDGCFEVGVHIADVSHFVRPGTAIDLEAAERGTTVYLCDQRIDMVPELLSSNLCSLRGGEERYAFSVIWKLTSEAEIVDVKFHKSVICSRAALTYQQAQDLIDNKKLDDPLAQSLRQLNNLSKKLRERRRANGALTLASMEIRFNIDSETRDPIAVQEKKFLQTNNMVEEFMLLANISVAQKINDEFPDCAVLRRHPVPAPANYKPVIQAAESRGFKLVVDSGKAIAESLDRATIDANPFFNTMLRILTTRCMTQAVYFASGTLPVEQYYH